MSGSLARVRQPVDPRVSSVRVRTCPQCHGRLVPIVWGFPEPQLIESERRGEVAIGGCCLPDPEGPEPVKACRDCGWQLLVVDPDYPGFSSRVPNV